MTFTGIIGPTYQECLFKIKQQYVTATAIGSMIGEPCIHHDNLKIENVVY